MEKCENKASEISIEIYGVSNVFGATKSTFYVIIFIYYRTEDKLMIF